MWTSNGAMTTTVAGAAADVSFFGSANFGIAGAVVAGAGLTITPPQQPPQQPEEYTGCQPPQQLPQQLE